MSHGEEASKAIQADDLLQRIAADAAARTPFHDDPDLPARIEELEAVRRYVDAIDFAPLKASMRGTAWSQGRLDYVERQYKNWLFLLRKHEGEGAMPASQDIDEFWHQHILDTRAYVRDSAAIFGRYMHHRPPYAMSGADRASADDAWERTQRRYEREYGEIIYDYDGDEDEMEGRPAAEPER